MLMTVASRKGEGAGKSLEVALTRPSVRLCTHDRKILVAVFGHNV